MITSALMEFYIAGLCRQALEMGRKGEIGFPVFSVLPSLPGRKPPFGVSREIYFWREWWMGKASPLMKNSPLMPEINLARDPDRELARRLLPPPSYSPFVTPATKARFDGSFNEQARNQLRQIASDHTINKMWVNMSIWVGWIEIPKTQWREDLLVELIDASCRLHAPI